MDHKGAIQYILKRLEQELPENLLYHGHHHTLDVMEATERIARHDGVNDDDLNLLLVAAAFHDCGFMETYKDHEEAGCKIAREQLPGFGFQEDRIERVCGMIMATKVPQDPKGPLEEILCDADLDYLGRGDFEPIANSLFKELKQAGIVADIKVWNRIQLSFLKQHHYHTSYGKTLRQPNKEEHLKEIQKIVAGYDD